MSARHAVYLLPGVGRRDPLRGLGEAWLGRDAAAAAIPAALPPGWSPQQLTEITTGARRYGFHATVKAPFRLADGVSVADLDARVAALARDSAPVRVPRIALAWLDGFAALVPGVAAPELHDLADAVVRDLEALRAPLAEAERARRRPERLTERQRELLDTFGYPYVLDEYRVHFTLTDRLDDARRAPVDAALRAHLVSQLGRDVPVDALCVFTEPSAGAPLVLRAAHPLGGSPAR